MAPKDRAAEAEQRSPLRLSNKISDASSAITSRLRWNIKEEIEKHRATDPVPWFFLQMATFTCLLPPHWESYPADLKMFLEKELFDPVMLHVLESEGLMNWCPSVRKVQPMITPGDGNCLLHAVSLALWGMEDDELILRTALFRLLRDDQNALNRMRWQRERMRVDAAIPGSGFMYNTMEWHTEWDMIKEIASPEQRPATAHGLPYESLEQFHIFMLSNMLRRPIIVVAQDMMRSQWGHSLQPQHLHGIYLPLNWDPSVCCRYPILLGFHQNHFTPLFCTAQLDTEEDDTSEYLFPIVQRDYTRMTVHFLEEDEETRVDSLLGEYLIIKEVLHMGLGNTHGIPGARLASKNNHPDLDLMIPYLRLAETHYRAYLEMEYGNAESFTVACGGKADTKSERILEKPLSLREQPIIREQAEQKNNSWSVLGNPLSHPLDPEHKAGNATGQNPAYNRTYSLVNKTCKTPGCEYYRSITTGEYCHQCYTKQMKSDKCQGEGCLNPADQSCQDLCRVCFDQKKLMEFSPLQATAPPLSKMSLDPTSQLAFANTPPVAASSRPGKIEPSPGASSDRGNRTLGRNPSPDDELNSLIVHQKLATKKCIIPECPLTGDPTKNDMCSNCYEENLKAAQEITRPKIISQPGQTRNEFVAQSAFEAASGGATDSLTTGASACAGYIASSASGQKPRNTVQKNICGNAGCEGVRLVDKTYLGYCFDCYKRNYRKPDQGPSSPDPVIEGRNTAGAINRKFAKWQDPLPQSNPNKIWLQQREIANNMEVAYGNAPHPHFGEKWQSKAETQTIVKHVAAPLNVTEVPQCKHHLCNEPAAPPKYKLCLDCIAVYACNEDKPSVESAAQIITSSAKAENLLPGRRQPEEPKQPTAGSTSPTLQRTAAGFKSARINRIKCQAPEGCPDDMFGDPELGNFCSRCFNMVSMRRTRTRATQPVCQAETRPTQSATRHQNHTAPLYPSPHDPLPPQTSKTEVMYINPERSGHLAGSPKHYTRPANYWKCTDGDCENQANPQILDGYCNDCYRVYRQHGYVPVMLAAPHTAPLNPSPRDPLPPRTSTTEVLYRNPERSGQLAGSPKHYTRPANYQKCTNDDCKNQANPQILDGYCNECYRVYRHHGYVPEIQAAPQVPPRGRFAQSSQSTVPKAWVSRQIGLRSNSEEEKILNIAIGEAAPPVAEPNRTDMGCRSEDCTNFGNPRCQGYCNSCFRVLKKN